MPLAESCNVYLCEKTVFTPSCFLATQTGTAMYLTAGYKMVFKCSGCFTYKCGAQCSAKDLPDLRLPDAETHTSIYFNSRGLRK